ncbi:hypothetical protein [Sutcliffiella horikoshii]|uniref:hypothetical protein n=1 Tax=Sutcliffiella horikoshii TaxID=79883 RepID=UPI0038513CD7
MKTKKYRQTVPAFGGFDILLFLRCCVVCVSVLLLYPGRLGFIPGFGWKQIKICIEKEQLSGVCFPFVSCSLAQ